MGSSSKNVIPLSLLLPCSPISWRNNNPPKFWRVQKFRATLRCVTRLGFSLSLLLLRLHLFWRKAHRREWRGGPHAPPSKQRLPPFTHRFSPHCYAAGGPMSFFFASNFFALYFFSL